MQFHFAIYGAMLALLATSASIAQPVAPTPEEVRKIEILFTKRALEESGMLPNGATVKAVHPIKDPYCRRVVYAPRADIDRIAVFCATPVAE